MSVHRRARSGGRSRPLGDECCAGNPVVDEQTDELVEHYFEIVVAGKFVAHVDDPVVSQADRVQVRLAAEPDRDLSEPRRSLEVDAYDRLALVRLDWASVPAHLKSRPSLGTGRNRNGQRFERKRHARNYRTPGPGRR